ncbi:hypothetical protein AJ80_05786 [Polytolypa hystricis UAMH7299]|uniref:RING-type domain-containing protein n=1 Tax=Polytolypa hystricis (strain UAMH7299) TaxID=1447883 RepID=A0A2B7Y0P9_POLH7|nr:hypothetical protein AJ80_05786 [Polytolypa hystricis UAMH7299]
MPVVTNEALVSGPVPDSLVALFSGGEATNEASGKRRKLRNRDVKDAENALYDYLTVARFNLKITFNQPPVDSSAENKEYHSARSATVPVVIQNIAYGRSALEQSSHDNHPISLSSSERVALEGQRLGPPKLCRLRLSLVATETVFDELLTLKIPGGILGNADRSVSLYRSYAKSPIVCSTSILRRVDDDELSFLLETRIHWRDSVAIPERLNEYALLTFAAYLPGDQLAASSVKHHARRPWASQSLWSPSDFYDNVHIPPKTPELSAPIKSDVVHSELFPFQRRAVRWLLEREGVEVLPSGHVQTLSETPEYELPDSFAQIGDADGRICYVSHLYRVLTTDLENLSRASQTMKGGILAEEMGLGKTVEMISLISLHRRENVSVLRDWPELSDTGATLIVTPPAILEQWKEEITSHAPGLRYVCYDGIGRSKRTNEEIVREFATADIVLTTYSVLRGEVYYAEDPPERSLRKPKKLPARKSPLVQMSWWRVCIDEAQMIESGVSNAARVALLIPRVNAWAVTGTPLRKDMKDLFGLFLFLRCDPFCFSLETWVRLFEDHKPILKTLIGRLVLRHNKDVIRDELHLPPQKRIVITVPFTAIEEQHYSQLFQEMCEECSLDRTGAPTRENWDPEKRRTIDAMRSWLARLRQTCLHPEVSGAERRALGGVAGGPLRTVAEVLEVMIDQNETKIRTAERELLMSHIRRGQLMENAGRQREALKLWQDALEGAQAIVKDCRAQLTSEKQKLQLSQMDMDGDSSDDDEDEESKREDKLGKISIYRQRLRPALEVEHICKFFIANAYYQIKTNTELTKPDSEEYKELEKLEEESYEAAKLVRKELLAETNRRVSRHLNVVRDKADKEGFVTIPEMSPSIDKYGMESRRFLDQLESFCEAMNLHAKKYTEWRDHMAKLLLQSLIDEDDDAQLEGNEYESSTKHQEEMYVYMEALRVMFADRHDALTGQKNFLIAHELKQGLEKAKAGEGPSPELFISLTSTCKELRVPKDVSSLRGIISDLRGLATSLEWQESRGSSRARSELAIINELLHEASQMSSTQSKLIPNLEREVELFRDVMNKRLEYYRQLQQISDTVAPYDEESKGTPLDQEMFDKKLRLEENLDTKISGLKSKHRYLIHLGEAPGEDDDTRICIICQSSFEQGVLTVCGHRFCKDCLKLWWRQHRNCPMCKMRLKIADFHEITYKPREIVAQEEKTETHFEISQDTHSVKNSIYSGISSKVLQEIKNIDIGGSFGTKIDTLARHLIWLRQHDPGAKSIVFSQYKSFLGILSRAFSRFKIGFTSVDSRDGIERFKHDPSIECFLLHARAHSSGLNLVNATHVFLCEPLVNTAIELQAIARVHRIGQHRETTVWMYLVSDTVEETIYGLSVSRRLAHIARKHKAEEVKGEGDTNGIDDMDISKLTEIEIDAANSLELQDAAIGNLMGSTAAEGERVDADDLWQCLFGHADNAKIEASEDARNEVSRFLRAEAAESRRLAVLTNGPKTNGDTPTTN